VVSPFDGRVASQDALNVAVITSPNQDWVPAHPVERRVVRTFSDGLWGEHEYSRWPQPMIRNMWHLGCIPSLRHPQPDIPPAVWTLLSPSRDWAEDVNVGVPGLGFLLPDIRSHLCQAAEYATSKFMTIVGVPPHRISYGEQLCLVLRQCLERMMRLPSDAVVSIAVGAHIQRVT
ncbi:uncharacterized protein BXZ73DRAFT_1567, partial [Epithele typhae]|uniref:uncharacterized protein n=1 Tax=Epithele typhae TaxID=378194 RepID=UPI00200802D0